MLFYYYFVITGFILFFIITVFLIYYCLVLLLLFYYVIVYYWSFRTALDDVYFKFRDHVVAELVKSPRHAAVTTDCWSDNFRLIGYVAFTFHFLTSDFEVRRLLLTIKQVMGRHTGENLCAEYRQCLAEFKLSSKQIFVVRDCGANIVKACRLAGVTSFGCQGNSILLFT